MPGDDLYIETHPKDRITTVSIGPDEVGRVIVRDRLNNRPPYMYVYGLYVEPEYRRRGAGTALIATICDEYRDHRLEIVAHSDGSWPGEAELAVWLNTFGFIPGLSASGKSHGSDEWRMYRPADLEHPHDHGDYSDVQ